MRIIVTAGLIFAFWFLLSGHTSLLLLVLGALSTALIILLANRMRVIDKESYPVEWLISLFKFYPLLSKEIVLANLDVIKRIIMPGKTISPTVVKLPAKQTTNLGKVVFANSITLTPGTVTMDLNGAQLTVHALSEEGADDLATERLGNAIPDKEAKPS